MSSEPLHQLLKPLHSTLPSILLNLKKTNKQTTTTTLAATRAHFYRQYIRVWSFLLSHKKTFTPHCFHVFLLSLCRASIVQKRIIYFQDEGPLTRRMCEKGRLLYRHGMNNLPPVSYPFRLPAASLFRSLLLLSFSACFFLNHYFLLYLIFLCRDSTPLFFFAVACR